MVLGINFWSCLALCADRSCGRFLFCTSLLSIKGSCWGKYFRIAADVIVDGENLADMLIEAGMAVRYDGGKKTHKWCE